jgi:polyphosphate kinase
MKKIKPDAFINREFSWLEFNNRVLFEAAEKKNPLLERIKFLSIVSSNLEEFFMVRVAVLKKRNDAEMGESSQDTQTSREQLKVIREKVIQMMGARYELFYSEMVPELLKNGVRLLTSYSEIEQYRDYLAPVFENEIKPLLTPLSVGPTHPFPTLVTGRLYLALGISPLVSNRLQEKSNLSFIEVPTSIFGRFLKLQHEETYIPVENIIKLFIGSIYNGYQVNTASVIKISRDADFSLQEDGASDLLKEIESTIRRMHRRSVVKVEYEAGTPDEILKIIMEKNIIKPDDLYEINGILNLRDLMELYEKINMESLKYKPIVPVYPAGFKKKDIFNVIEKQDRLLFHPYHSFDPVIELVSRAAEDPDVLAIKQTLYRTSSDSAIIKALIKAAENGKYVSVIDELKARFDEKRNIEWARKLEDVGAHVTYGVSGLKTHAKALIIIRKEQRGLRRYIHLGTGNYNETTARQYTDFSFFTSDDKYGEDVSSLFNLLTGFSLSDTWKCLTLSPLDLRQKFLALIRRETENAGNKMKAKITAKFNSLSDYEMINALYEASQAGVKIELIVRGICSLIPGIKGLSENIRVISIVGRYLEHSRIYYFYNAGEEEYYLSSADWMLRNLDKRVEILFPVKDPENQSFIRKILNLQFEDNANTWELHSDKTYQLISPIKKSAPENDSFEQIYQFIRKMEEGRGRKSIVEFEPIRNPGDKE